MSQHKTKANLNASEVKVDPELQEKLQVLRSAITDPPPFCSGVLALDDEAFTLIYGKREPQRRSWCVVEKDFVAFLP